jgi:hypothetical protein
MAADAQEGARTTAFLTANADRDGKKYKKLPVTFYAFKLAHLNVADPDRRGGKGALPMVPKSGFGKTT